MIAAMVIAMKAALTGETSTARDVGIFGSPVWQSAGHCLTFCFQRFEFTANGSRSIE